MTCGCVPIPDPMSVRRCLDVAILSIAAAAIAAFGCQPQTPAGPSPGGTGVVTAILISPATVTLDSGASAQLTAEARGADGSVIAAAIAWSTSSPAVATVTTDGTVTATAGGSATITASSGNVSRAATVTVRDVHDLDARGVPVLATSHYLDPASVDRISLFRSAVGHDYSDGLERCRSMKHYFMPRATLDWSTLAITSPVDGTIVDLRPETTFGTQVQIRTTALAAAAIVIFHVVPDAGISVGARVNAGQRIGRHVGSQTMSDIAVWIETPRGRRLVSYIDTMSDAAFAAIQARGASSRAALVIPRADRDANPLVCSGEQFADAGALASWFVLQ
jgi:hypothetical protein